MELLSSVCPLNFFSFPLDAQTCNLTFGVLAHSSSQVQVKMGNQLKVSSSQQAVSSLKGEWELLSIQEVKVHFERRSAIRVQVTVRRRALFYIVNLIVPSALLMLLDVMGFFLPPSNKQRLTYKATTFIGYFIFILMVFTLFPPFMGPLPLIEVYLIGSLGLLVLSNLQTVAMFRLSNGRSPWTQKYFSAFLLECCDGYKRENTKGAADSEVKFPTCGSDTSEEKLERSRLLKMNEEVKMMKKQLQTLRMEQEFLSRCREFGSMLDQIYLYLHVSTLILSATVLYIIWPYKT
ncbi:5-hydroxytryptamine receptor 3A-like [Erpetoichthys calabaricus]|uniref:5-hydroxytryptamine receptor 3A-like n=1 Tax=Erpetoichthys calabaricus TaxID=27687 RepID=UPI002234BF57|nr:5-hydroxytryptamine receptor 3A-like [Erpetoichthys calabaricus]